MNNFSKNLKYLRLTRKNSQTEASDSIGVSPSNWNNWEKGLNYPKIELLSNISNYFDISIDDLIKVDLAGEVLKKNEVKSFQIQTGTNEQIFNDLINTQKELIGFLKAKIVELENREIN